MITFTKGCSARSRSVVSKPSIPGMETSMITMSGGTVAEHIEKFVGVGGSIAKMPHPNGGTALLPVNFTTDSTVPTCGLPGEKSATGVWVKSATDKIITQTIKAKKRFIFVSLKSVFGFLVINNLI